MLVQPGRLTARPIPALSQPASLDLNFMTGTMPSGLTFTRASTAWAYNSAGVLTSYATDAPRLDYDPASLAARGLLVEEARTNLALQSSTYTDATWAKAQSTATAAAALAPSGATDGTALLETATTGVHNFNQPLSTTNATAYTLSIYAKPNGRNFLQIFFFSTGFGTAHFANFDLSLGVLGTAGGSATATMAPAGNGWYRCSITCTATATSASSGYGFSTIISAAAARNASHAGSTSAGLYCWHAQCEAGSFATSPIPTASAAVTRAADVCSMPTGSWFSASEGTLYAEGASFGSQSVLRALAEVGDGTFNNRALVDFNNAGANNFGVTTGGAAQVNISPSAYTSNAVTKIAGAYKANDCAAAANGTLGTPDTVASIPTVNRLYVGNQGAGFGALNGWLRRISYHNRRLENGLLQRLTS